MANILILAHLTCALDHKINKEAIQLLSEKYDWVYYGGKHFESCWTSFFQSYFLPEKFGYDKRRAHLASLIVSGQLMREEELKELEVPPYNKDTIEEDIEFISKKLSLTNQEF